MHSERVSRHVNGVEQALAELSEGVSVLADNQNQRIDRLVADVTKLDKLYSTATNSSRPVHVL